MKKFFIIPLLASMALTAGVIALEGGSLMSYLGISAALLTCGVSFLVLLTQYTPGEMGSAFAAATGNAAVSDMKKALVFFETMQRTVIAAGILGTMIGFIYVLSKLSDISKTGVGIALSLITLLYAVVIVTFITVPFIGAIRKKLAA
ncbi:MAG: MotA/TolQ/ExbB proton channel family protein [Spirochaetes bacterium]|nr:MotA/TolQ/ExbB proton channel family protein [Spirochaetota bacterium]